MKLSWNGFFLQLPKECREALQASKAASAEDDVQPAGRNITQDYAQLDKSTRASDAYLAARASELEATLKEVREAVKNKEAESDKLEEEVEKMEEEVRRREKEVEEKERRLKEADGGRGVQMAMQRNKLQQKIQEQHELILSLQGQLDTYIYRSFPSLG